MAFNKHGTWRPIVMLLLAFTFFSQHVLAKDDERFIKGTGVDGVVRELAVDRYPSLYTADFADCLHGESLFNITNFDAALYMDNLTVLFHLDGTTNVRNENLVLHMAVEAYGENRFNMTYNPCDANIHSLCPLNASVPINAMAIIPLSKYDLSGIPSLAVGIPDFEGFTRLQIFANSTQTEIGCFQARMTNGNSFSQPESVGSFVGIMVFFAVLSSFATAIYGLRVSAMRMHYAHSFSVLVIFETFQSMFFSGALAVNWPSVLPAWWSNFAWTAGMMAPDSMVNSFSSFAGNSGNLSQVGGAGSTTINNGGGLIQQIYGRDLPVTESLVTRALKHAQRAAAVTSDPIKSYSWNGDPVTPGLPMPGTWPGFGGTLSKMNIPETEAFVIGLIWLLVVLVAVVLFIIAAKLTLDLLAKIKWLKSDGFDYFRSHLWGYVTVGVLRTLFIAFFAMMTLSLHQFAVHGPAAPTAIAGIVFAFFLVGIGGVAAYACYVRLRDGKYEASRDEIRFETGTIFKSIPFVAATRRSNIDAEEEIAERPRLFATMPTFGLKFRDNDPERLTTHQDENFIERFGWLFGRYRRTRWWFFAFYLAYQFVRACFIGGGSNAPMVQVYGLLVFEILALLAIIKMNPFESSRNTAVAVWMLSISKIVTAGLSVAFLPAFNINRIWATVFGVVIVVVQGFLAVAILVLIVLGMVSSWFSLNRNHEDFHETLEPMRVRYFERMEARSEDLPPKPKSTKKVEEPDHTEKPIEPYFNVRDVRRAPKIEDGSEDEKDAEPNEPVGGSRPAQPRPLNRHSRANSASSRHSISSLPRAARVHRTSWSSRDFSQWDAEIGQRMSRRPPMTPAREDSEDAVMTLNTIARSGREEDVNLKKDDEIVTEEKPVASPISPTEGQEQAEVSLAQHVNSTGAQGV